MPMSGLAAPYTSVAISSATAQVVRACWLRASQSEQVSFDVHFTYRVIHANYSYED